MKRAAALLALALAAGHADAPAARLELHAGALAAQLAAQLSAGLRPN